jgi:prepilin-type N-terminal cleavage/methylation domain-containing protein
MSVPTAIASSPARLLREQRGMTLVEALVASLILAIAAAGLLGAFDAGREEANYSEKHNTATAIAEKEIVRLTALPWKQVANNTTEVEGWTVGSSSTDPTHYFSKGKCVETATLPSHEPCYQWDWTKSSAIEPLALEPEAEVNKTEALKDPYSFETLTPKKATRISGKIYRYITWVNDGKCEGTKNTCTSTSSTSYSNYKRITVIVTVTGMKKPVILSTLYTNPEGSTNNPLFDGATCKEEGKTVECVH